MTIEHWYYGQNMWYIEIIDQGLFLFKKLFWKKNRQQKIFIFMFLEVQNDA